MSFNRTFMELKFSSIHHKRIGGSTFQSYLYGIEMHVLDFRLYRWPCFNRTFMELK